MKKISTLTRVLLSMLFITLIIPTGAYLTNIYISLSTIAFAQEDEGINLLTEAPNAVWFSGYGRLLFGGSRDNPRGFAIYRKGLLLEDGSRAPSVLETHPRWIDEGLIRGEFYIPRIRAGQHFITSIGFIMPAGGPRTNGVTIKIIFNNVTLYDDIKRYTRKLEDIRIDMSTFDKQSGTLILEVGTNGDSTQDWLIWKNTHIR